MPPVRKIANLFPLCAALLLLAACASSPDRTQAQGVAPRTETPTPVLGFRALPPAARPAPASPPLDASRLPPFEGGREEVRGPRLAKVDRTVRQDDVW